MGLILLDRLQDRLRLSAETLEVMAVVSAFILFVLMHIYQRSEILWGTTSSFIHIKSDLNENK